MSSLAGRVRGIVSLQRSRRPVRPVKPVEPVELVEPLGPLEPVEPGEDVGPGEHVGPREDDRSGRRGEVDRRATPLEPNRSASHDLEKALGGEWRGDCFVVERRWDLSARHGREAVRAVADRLRSASAEASLLAGGAPAREPFAFFDLETTGLSGGAGTHAFLVGCGWFGDREFVTRQFLLASFSGERALLEMVSSELAGAGALVSFNGKSFDAPVLETRYLFHRLAWPGACLPHLDVLHSARQFWKAGRETRLRAATRSAGDGCSLVSLERQVLGHRRRTDVAGFEIPSRYFQFVRTADAQLLVAVLEHNRLDLLSLAALTARLLHLAQAGPQAARDAREALALGRVYARAGLDARAREAFDHALETSAASVATVDRPIQIEALRSLAIAFRRARRFEEAAECWRRLLATPGCPNRLACDATEALAVHQEHRVRDLVAARTFALETLERVGLERPTARNEAVRHRLDRLERKMGPLVSDSRSPSPSLSLFSPSPPSSGFQTSGRRTSS